MRKKKEFEKTLNLLKSKELSYEKDGALWLKTSKYGDDDDRVIVRSDGAVSYFLSDIAYHINKFNRKYDVVIDIWGADHQGHVKRMMAVKKMFTQLGKTETPPSGVNWKGDLEILISQMVVLKEGEERKKLSKRAGTIVLLADLVNEVGIDAARWFYLEKLLSTHMEFDMVLAKERSRKNPVYYVQYAHARMSSILLKAGVAKKATSSPRAFIYKFLKDPTASPRVDEVAFLFTISDFQEEKLKLSPVIALIKKLIQFQEIIEDSAKDYQVQRLTTYAYELASEFSQFYRDVKVIGSENEKELIAIVALSKKLLSDTLKLLGISSPEKM